MLTTAQLATLKADIALDGQLNALPVNSDSSDTIAKAYNLAVAFAVWKSSIRTVDIFDQIVWSNLTPQDAVPTDTALNNEIWRSRSLACQGKQFNLQTMLSGRETINPSKANIRAGLNDALTALPSGPAGAARQAGWVNVVTILSRQATRVEKLFADTSNGNGVANPALLTFEGAITYQDVDQARAG